ncbi:MAG: tetratricopeptide repeat protein [Verrucomicrobiaceae bacterium]|nr:tetratricopeptide repeat protein [Verrucomicrobiaceae bacterium]
MMMTRAAAVLFLLAISAALAGAGPTEDALRVGEEAFAKKEYASAVTTWTNAYNERATAGTADDETCATVLLKLADLLVQVGRAKEAVVCYENLLVLRRKLGGEENLEMHKAKRALAAQIANTGGNLDRAEQLAREAADGFGKLGGESSEDRLVAMTTLAGVLLVKKERIDAHEIYSQVLALSEKDGAKSMKCAVEACNGMAAIADFFGRSKDKLQYMRKAVDLSRQHLGAHDPATYLARIDYAGAQSASGLNTDAKATYEGILADLEKKPPSPSERVLQQRWAVAAYRLAYVESALDHPDRTYELAKEALVHAKSGWGDLDANTMAVYLDLAKLHIMHKNFDEGVKCYQKVLDIRRRELGPDHESTRETQKILNELLEDVRKAREAAKK